jgi:hypothetical protein
MLQRWTVSRGGAGCNGAMIAPRARRLQGRKAGTLRARLVGAPTPVSAQNHLPS